MPEHLVRTHRQSECYRHGDLAALDEGRDREFKGLGAEDELLGALKGGRAGRGPRPVAEYICGFLNSVGGAIYYGVDDEGRIHGTSLTRKQRDAVRLYVDGVLATIQPSVDSPAVRQAFVPIVGMDDGFVLRIDVPAGSERLYMTSSCQAYYRLDASTRLMRLDMIRDRLLIGRRAGGEPSDYRLSAMVNGMLDYAASVAPGTIADLESPALCTGVILAMVKVSWADRALARQEVALISEHAQRRPNAGLDLERIRRSLLDPPDPSEIARHLKAPAERKLAAMATYVSVLCDHVLTEEEVVAYHDLCSELGIPDRERQEVMEEARRLLWGDGAAAA